MRGRGAHLRVWAPKRRAVHAVVFQDERAAEPFGTVELTPEEAGYFSAAVPQASAGMLYGFRLDGQERLLPDPASRFQPQGPSGLSQMIDPSAFGWTDSGWRGVPNTGQVLYEMHVGTFTPEGTWKAAASRLPQLAELGITVLEIMPVADFPGNFGWGYDGVCLFAPMRLYGQADDFRRFVDRAHGLGLGVIQDVVYNHFGTRDCFVCEFADEYYSTRYKNEWGAPINFDGERS